MAAGDTLASVARDYRVSSRGTGRRPTSCSPSDGLEGVAALVVPVPPAAAPSAHTRLYTVRRGDTLVTIADRFGVSLSQLRRWNKITGIKVEPGRRIHVAEPVVVQRASSGHRRRTSAAGAKFACRRKNSMPTGHSDHPRLRPERKQEHRAQVRRETHRKTKISRSKVKNASHDMITHLCFTSVCRASYCYNDFRKRNRIVSCAK